MDKIAVSVEDNNTSPKQNTTQNILLFPSHGQDHTYSSAPTALQDPIQEDKEEEESLPELIVNEGQLRNQTKEISEALMRANRQRIQLVIHLSVLSKVEEDENGNPTITPLNTRQLLNELTKLIDFKARKKGELEDVLPPMYLGNQILALPPHELGLPILKAIEETPVLCKDKSILDQPGYDPKTRLYYIPSAGMERCQILDNPSQQDAVEAMGRIKALFADFPFEGPADYANTIALLFTPFVRHAISGDVQMGLIDGTNPGVGKTLLAQVISIIATGQPTIPMTTKESNAEWRKSLSAELRQTPRIILIDNARTTLDSTALEAMLTGPGLNDRLLNQSKNIRVENKSVLMVTGNNIKTAGDLSSRLLRIRLISQTDIPEERDNFAIKDLEQHVTDRRPEYISDILTVARAWYAANKPPAMNIPNLRTFTNWAKVIGGMLEFTGVKDFQGNRAELRSQNNEEGQQWEGLLLTWENLFGSKWILVSEITQNPRLTKILPSNLKKAHIEKPDSFALTLGIHLGKKVQTVYGKEKLRLEKRYNRSLKQEEWRVTRVVAGSPNPQPQNEATEGLQKGGESTEENHNIANNLSNYPQLPARAKSEEPINEVKANTDQTAKSQVAGSSEKKATAYPLGRMPSEYLARFTEYQAVVMESPSDTPIWHAPKSGFMLMPMKKQAHIDYTKALLKSGDNYKVHAALEAMGLIIDSNGSEVTTW